MKQFGSIETRKERSGLLMTPHTLFRVPIYNVDARIVIAKNPVEIRNRPEFLHLYDGTPASEFLALCSFYQNSIYLFFHESKEVPLDIICHETFHATTHIMYSVGIMHDGKTEEAYAYLHEFLFSVVRQIYTDAVRTK